MVKTPGALNWICALAVAGAEMAGLVTEIVTLPIGMSFGTRKLT